MSLPSISIHRPVLAWMIMAALIIFGWISYGKLGISQLPDVNFPVVGVGLSLPGAAPEVVESQVLDPIEDAIMTIDGVKSVTSSAQQSSGSISVEFELGRDIDSSLQEVKNHINQVRNLLPTDLFPPRFRKTNPEDQPIMWIALSSNDPKIPLIELMVFAKDYLENQLSMVPGVGDVVMGGYVDPALRVWVDTKKLKAQDLTSEDVVNAIQAEQIELPAGMIQNSQREYQVRMKGEAASPETFGQIRISSRGSEGINYKPILLKDVATVEEGTADIRRISRSNGRPAIGLGIIKQHGTNAVAVAQGVRDKVEYLRPLMPKRLRLDVRNDSTRFIKQSVKQLLFTLLLSAILTSFVCYLFLGSWTSTMNVLLAIPTSIIGTFIIFYAFHFTLNTFTLLGLSLAIGIVVDDAIMMLENIVRHRELGEERKEAALKGAEEISFAAIAATLAVVAIFIPVVYMKGVIGRFFFQYGITVSAAVLLSLLEALTLTPMRCSRYLEVEHGSGGSPTSRVDRFFHALANRYQSFLKVLLAHRWKTVGVAFLFFLGSWAIARSLPGELMPTQDQSQFMLRFKLPVGTSLQVTNQSVKKAEDYLLAQPEVSGIFSAVGGFGGDAVNQGMAFATMVDRNQRKVSQFDFMKKVRKNILTKIPQMETNIQDLSLRGFASTRGFPVEFIIQGPNWEKLTSLTKQVMAKMKESGLVVDVNTDVQSGMPEVQIVPDRKKMAEHAVSVGTVTKVINTLMGGLILNGQTEYPKGLHRHEIEVRLAEKDRNEIPDLKTVMVRNNRGEQVPLSELVDMTVKPSLVLISRLNRSRAITVYGNPAPGHSQQEAMAGTEKLARELLPPGYTIKMIGSSESFRESFQSLMVALVLGIVVSYMVLASQFNSFIHPLSVLTALPFSFSGAFIGLSIAHQSINMYSMIGFILLMGIVKKNSILLVDYTNHLRNQRSDVSQALLAACPVRLRPILMTSIATVAGALPEAISVGPGSEAMQPMAIAIIGGVIASTVLTLFVVPCVYSLMSRFERSEVEV
jgi:HAE1 family hydrophobic/amphiphilic exporter-1